MATGRRHGLTLLEMVVAIVLLGLTAVLVVPSWLPPRRLVDGAQREIDEARRVAIRRAESITVSLGPTGEWTLRISPLGSCTLHSSLDAQLTPRIDPIRCRLLPVASPR